MFGLVISSKFLEQRDMSSALFFAGVGRGEDEAVVAPVV